MPLPLPDLDDRRWSDLVDESLSLIHRKAPDWTDYNVSDPGITLIDLLAWIAEADVFGVNQIPRRHRERFLALIGMSLRPVLPATTPLALSSTSVILMPRGAVFAAQTEDAQPIHHRLASAVQVLGCAVTAVQVWTGSVFVDRTQDWRQAATFEVLGPDPSTGSALLVGFDPVAALDPGAELSMWLTLDDGASSALDEDADRDHHSARTIWEYHDGTAWTGFTGAVIDETRSLTRSGRVVLPLGELGGAASTLGVLHDRARRWIRARLVTGRHDVAPRVSRILVDAGPVIQATAGFAQWRYTDAGYVPPAALGVGDFVRFRIRTNAHGRVLGFDVPGGDDDPRAVVLARSSGSITLTLLWAGVCDGAPLFETTVPGAPFTGDDTEVWTADTAGCTRWTAVDTLLRSGPTDHHVVIDSATGAMSFGDGERGRIPPAGSSVLVAGSQTLGINGTPTARSVWRLDSTHPLTVAATVSAPIAATDIAVSAAPAVAARAADDLEAGEGRAADEVWSHERLLELAQPVSDPTLDQLDRTAVLARRCPQRAATTIDFERLALHTPGTAVQRVRAWSGLDPAQPTTSAPGTVTVVVVPGLPAARPTPTSALLAAVRRYLCPRRTLGTRLVVTGPHYVEVSVRTVLATLPRVNADRVRAAAEQALYRFLHPLTGGPKGRGWPFGRDVYQSEILRLLDLIDGVDHADEIDLVADGVDAGCGNVTVGPVSLVVSGTHQVVVR